MYDHHGNSLEIYNFKMQRANAYYDAGRHQEAINILKEVLGELPEDADAHALLSLNLLETGRINAAEFEISLALKIRPNDPLFHWTLGRIYILKNRPKLALSCADECLRLEPNYFLAHLLKSNAFQFLGKTRQALESIHEAAKIEPNNIEITITYIGTYIAKGDLANAEQLCLEVLQQNAEHEGANVHMGNIKLAQGEIEDAEYHAKFVIINNPNSTEALELLANIKLRKSKLMGLWWWFNSKLARMSQLKSTTVLIAAYVFFVTLSQIVGDLGYSLASNVISYAWIAVAAYSWIGIPAYYRTLEKELSQFQFNSKF